MKSHITLGNFTIDRDRCEVTIDEHIVHLTFVEFEILWYLARRTERVVSRRELIKAIQDEASAGSEPALTVHISRLRKKVRGMHPYVIGTSRRRGYALKIASSIQRPIGASSQRTYQLRGNALAS